MAITFTIASLIRVHLISYWMMPVSIAIFTLQFARCFAFVPVFRFCHCDKLDTLSATITRFQRTIVKLRTYFI